MPKYWDVGGQRIPLDGILKQNLDRMMVDIRKDDDVLLIIDGKERIGKSVLAMQIGFYMSGGKFELKDVCLTPEEFKNRVMEAEKYRVIIFDEAYMGLASEDHMKHYNRLLKKMLITVGQKNLILILVLPSVFELSKYAVLHRSDALISCFKKGGKRGYFMFYNEHRLKNIYIFGKKTYSYGFKKHNFWGNYPNYYTIDEKEYREKKDKALQEFLSDDETKDVSVRTRTLYNAINMIKKLDPSITNKEIADKLDLSPRTIYRALKEQI